MSIDLMDHQKEAIDLLGPGKILYGGVGTGKTMAALAYYAKEQKVKIYMSSLQLKSVTLSIGKERLRDWESVKEAMPS